MNIFESKSYKNFVQSWIKSRPKGGRGEYTRMAERLRISSVQISHIFNGDRDLSPEQAVVLAEYLNLGKIERNFFVLLVHHARAGTNLLREFYSEELQKLEKNARDLRHRAPNESTMSEKAKSIYYANWQYAAVRLLTSIPGFETPELISQKLQIPPKALRSILDFLLENGLCVLQDGKFQMGTQHLHLPKDSPYIKPRHISWRLKAIEHLDHPSEEDLFFSSPVSLSKRDFAHFQMEITKFIEAWLKSVAASPSEELACLNIDWFSFRS